MTTVVAITGGIGSGKSTFSKEVKKRGLSLLDSDEEVGKIYNNPTKKFFEYLNKIKLNQAIKGTKIDKKIISNIIFSNPQIKSKLEDYIFKIVREKRNKFIKREKKKKTKTIFLDIPLLLENHLEKDFDIVISIISKKNNRYERLKKTKNIQKDLFDKIIKSQTTDLIRKKNSSVIIYNNNGIFDYLIKINNVIDKIIK